VGVPFVCHVLAGVERLLERDPHAAPLTTPRPHCELRRTSERTPPLQPIQGSLEQPQVPLDGGGGSIPRNRFRLAKTPWYRTWWEYGNEINAASRRRKSKGARSPYRSSRSRASRFCAGTACGACSENPSTDAHSGLPRYRPKAGRNGETVIYPGPHALGMRREDCRNGRDRLKNGRKDFRSGPSRFRNGLEDPDRGQSAFHNREIDFDCDRSDRADLLGRCSPRSERVAHSSNRFRAREKEPGRLTRALFQQSK